MYKAVIIGSGNRSHAHIQSYQKIDNAYVTACSGRTREKREAVSLKYGIKSYEDAEEMVRKEKPDMVHIVTPPSARVELMRIVSDAGVPLCTVEKPIATGVSDWREIQRIESSSETKFAVSHQVRWQKYLVKCREALNEELAGKVIFMNISSGMNISGQGTHALDYGMSMNGEIPVTSVFANITGWDMNDRMHSAPLITETNLVFKNGATCLWTTGPISPRCGDPECVWQHIRIAVYAERGRVLFEQFGNWEIAVNSTRPIYERGDFGGMATWQDIDLEAQTDFHKSMFEWHENPENPSGTNLKQSLHEWAVVLASYQSALEHRRIYLDEFNPPENLVEQLKEKLL